MIRRLIAALSVMLLVASFAAGGAAADSLPTAFVHVNVIPMDQERVLEDQTVIVAGGRINQMGPAKAIKVPGHAKLIDGRGKYLIPGLIDAHVHLESTTEFALYLANGVTTVFNLDGRPAHLRWRRQIADGEMVGPTIFSTGPIFHQRRTPEEDIQLVDEQAAAGYDGIKVYNQVSKEEYPALINEAKRKNMLLMGHVAREPGFAMTLQYGQSIAHLEEFIYTNFEPSGTDDFDHIVLDDSKIPAIVRETKDSGIYVTATLNTFATIVEQATNLDAFLKNPDLHYVAPWTLANYQPDHDGYKKGFGPDKYQILRDTLAIQRKLLKALSDAGVPLMTGTDATEVGPISGFGLHHELQEFVNDGLTPYEALKAATMTPAQYLRGAGEFGTVTAGKRADLVLLAANPLADISNAQKIEGVIVRGRWLPESELNHDLQQVPEKYRQECAQVETMLRENPPGAIRYFGEHDPLGLLQRFTISVVAANEGREDLVRMLERLRAADPKAQLVSEQGINALGYDLLGKKLYPQAIAVLETNTRNFPKSANTFDSLAEAYADSGDISSAITNYEHALGVDPTYANADVAKKFIADHSQK
jgi:imidazolonepropionase-like amidohydrolase